MHIECKEVKNLFEDFTMKCARNKKDGVLISWEMQDPADGYVIYVSETVPENLSVMDILHEEYYYYFWSQSKVSMKWKKVAEVAADKNNYLYKQSNKDKYLIYMVRPKADIFEGEGSLNLWRFVAQPGLKNVTNNTKGITLNWSKVKGAERYFIYRSCNNGSYERIAIMHADKTSMTDKKVSNGKTYRYKIAAVNYRQVKNNFKDVILSAYSASRSTIRLSRPAIRSLKTAGSGKLKVTWNKDRKAGGYEVRYAASSSFKSAKTVKISKNTTLSKTIKSLKKHKYYYVKVRSFKKIAGRTYYSKWSKYKKCKVR